MAFVNGLEMVPENSVLCIEERNGNIKSIYALYVASERARTGTPVTYLTLQTKEDVQKKMEQLRISYTDLLNIVEIQPGSAKREVLAVISEPKTPLVIIDPFSVFFAEDTFSDLNTLLFGLISTSRKGSTFLLLVDTGVLPERQENLVRAMADGIIEFTILQEGDKLKHYINIPKMRGAFPRDKMLPFTVNDEGLLIDTRERHG
jgi:KaiC/GvpD/RAD55 family RecA-like ATPase